MRRLWVVLVTSSLILGLTTGLAEARPADPTTRQAEFAAAAREFGVPVEVLLATSYNISQWDQYAGAPSTTGAYGVMGLVSVPPGAARGVSLPAEPNALERSAALAGVSRHDARYDTLDNIRAGAALLVDYADGTPTEIGDWYAAVARYSGSVNPAVAQQFADDVFATIRTGATRRTEDGESIRLAPSPSVQTDRSDIAKLNLAKPAAAPWDPECPSNMNCSAIEAAYQLNNPKDKTSYGNYDLASRPDTMKVNSIVLHDTETSYDGTIAAFTNPARYASAHYVVRSSDGHVTQMVRGKNVAWHAGNYYVNMHSIGIEQEGYAIDGAAWYTQQMVRSTARLVKYLCARYNIPKTRLHILGHDNVPGPTYEETAAMHWDPGPFWPWAYFMTLIGAPISGTETQRNDVIVIAATFDTNKRVVYDCEGAGGPVAKQGVSFVPLRTGPSPNAGLYRDPALHPNSGPGSGTDCANDWGDKASTGQKFVKAGRSGGWTAIWWQGSKVWFWNPDSKHHYARISQGSVVQLKGGKVSAPVWGRAYPEKSDYPSTIKPQPLVPLQYKIRPGQRYVTDGGVPEDYYFVRTIDGSLPNDRTDIIGSTSYLRIQIGHRIGFVKLSDVNVF